MPAQPLDSANEPDLPDFQGVLPDWINSYPERLAGNLFELAERQEGRLRAAFYGLQGSGKTMSALQLMCGFAYYFAERQNRPPKVLVIDTEDRVWKYQNSRLLPKWFRFYKRVVAAPYIPDKVRQLLEWAVKEKFDVACVDSLTHFWNAPGGFLDQKIDFEAQFGGNSWAAWSAIAKPYMSFVHYLEQCPLHLVATLRGKNAWDQEQETRPDGRVVNKPKNLGIEPDFRTGILFSFDEVFLVDKLTHLSIIDRDDTGLFVQDKPVLMRPDHGYLLARWLFHDGDPREIKARAIADHYEFGKAVHTPIHPYAVQSASQAREQQAIAYITGEPAAPGLGMGGGPALGAPAALPTRELPARKTAPVAPRAIPPRAGTPPPPA